MEEYKEHSISTNGGTLPQAHNFLKLKYHPHSSHEKSIIERMMQYLNDRIEGFDDYFPYGNRRVS